jgi:hypothetical protein
LEGHGNPARNVSSSKEGRAMAQSPTRSYSTPGPSARERIDALLDQALAKSFPASDSSAIGSSIAAIKQEDRERDDGDRSTP